MSPYENEGQWVSVRGGRALTAQGEKRQRQVIALGRDVPRNKKVHLTVKTDLAVEKSKTLRKKDHCVVPKLNNRAQRRKWKFGK